MLKYAKYFSGMCKQFGSMFVACTDNTRSHGQIVLKVLFCECTKAAGPVRVYLKEAHVILVALKIFFRIKVNSNSLSAK
jgi:hypothetical protein